ncbi:MAG: hotdog fold thioesterase [Burkholderiales bacterium]|jgi:1,4-dihydroxy-2-naphthoyl-CoA hydrolase|nr:hotdog fold thioesterase [Burkholderiales bacterium]
MKVFKRAGSLDAINHDMRDTMIAHLGIHFTAITENSLEATMPVNEKTCQPFGYLHGGASCVLIETLGSCASMLCVDEGDRVVGVEINASHVKAVPIGDTVRGLATPIKIGNAIHVWEVRLFNQHDELCCVGRLTTKALKAGGSTM